jgi:Squalene-hopene cyclase C-terminal domain/Prenyltransferase and squalene oxidase repeat
MRAGLKRFLMLGVLWLSVSSSFLHAVDGPDAPERKKLQAVANKGIAYLRAHQGDDGSFSPRLAGPGVSALVATALLRNGVSLNDPMMTKLMAYLEKSVKDNGGVYDKGLANYTTSVAIMAFTEANTDHRYDSVIKKAVDFVKSLQNGATDGSSEDPRFGGLSYDGKGRPDMSNTQYFLDALQAAGVGKDDPAVKKALLFVSRCQNLPGENNDQAFAKKTTEDDRGGLVYNPLAGNNSRDQTPQGGLRSAGAMTYGGLKSFLYAGVSREDPRVQNAVRWIRAHYTLDANPGMGQAGLFYYYHSFAKAMNALGEDSFVDSAGLKHNWRLELFEALEKKQRPDGSWINSGDRQFGETDSNLSTAFALLALSYCR